MRRVTSPSSFTRAAGSSPQERASARTELSVPAAGSISISASIDLYRPGKTTVPPTATSMGASGLPNVR
jgi:hypothetical protein